MATGSLLIDCYYAYGVITGRKLHEFCIRTKIFITRRTYAQILTKSLCSIRFPVRLLIIFSQYHLSQNISRFPKAKKRMTKGLPTLISQNMVVHKIYITATQEDLSKTCQIPPADGPRREELSNSSLFSWGFLQRDFCDKAFWIALRDST